MIQILKFGEVPAEQIFARGTASADVSGIVAEIIAEVRKNGDAALRDGCVAIKGWTEGSGLRWEDFFEKLENLGVRTVICTDISRDGAMRGANRALYREIQSRFRVDLIASGGVSSLEDVRALSELGLYGTIIGKAWYTGAVDLRKAIEVAQ